MFRNWICRKFSYWEKNHGQYHVVQGLREMDCSNVNYIRATRLVHIGVIISKIESKYLIMGGEYQDTKGTYLFRYVPTRTMCRKHLKSEIWTRKAVENYNFNYRHFYEWTKIMSNIDDVILFILLDLLSREHRKITWNFQNRFHNVHFRLCIIFLLLKI